MNDDDRSTPEDESEERLDELLAEYLRRLDSGQPLDRDEFLGRYPELTASLRLLLDTAELVEGMAGPTVSTDPDARDDVSIETSPDPGDPGDPEETLPASGTYSGGEASEDPGSSRGGDPLRPCRFGDYELLEVIGRGGMGVVYKARQINMDRVVAVKMILTGRLASESDVHRFYTEARAAGQIDHPNVVEIYDVSQVDGHHYFSMDYIEGTDLAAVALEGPVEPNRAARYLRDAVLAIQAAHDRGILHRDLKPANILIDRDDRVLVTDFGLAKNLEQEGGITSTGAAMGTPSYMAPEQAAGEIEKLGPPTDVYALGAILYVMLTGRPPFRSPTVVQTMMAVVHEQPQPPTRVNPRADRRLSAICMKCLAKDPRHRYQTALELAEDLDRFLDDRPVRARSVGPVGRVGLWMWDVPIVGALAGRRVVTPTRTHLRVQNALLSAVFLSILAVLVTYFYVNWHRTAMPHVIRLTSGEKNGMYYDVADRLRQRLHQRLRREVILATSDGSVQNATRILDRESHLGLMQQSTINADELAVVAPLYDEVVHVVVRKAGGITRMSELAGRSVCLGKPGSGMRASAELVLNYCEIDIGELSDVGRPFVDLLTDESLDAAIVTTGPRHQDLLALLASGKFELIDIPNARGLAADIATFKHVPPDERDPRGIDTVATVAMLVTRRDAPDELVRQTLACLYEGRPPFDELIPLPKAVTIWSGLKYHYHPVSRTFYSDAMNRRRTAGR